MMIQIARPEPSNDGTDQSSLRLDRAERVDMPRKRSSRIERFVAQRPGFCLGAALSVGIALGLLVKR